MEIVNLKVGPYATNCYVVAEGASAMVIDPGAQPDDIIAAADRLGARIERIVLTHAHWDHICAVPALVEALGVPYLCHADDIGKLFDRKTEQTVYDFAPQAYDMVHAAFESGRALAQKPQALRGGEVIELGDAAFEVIHTPGHSAGCICLYCDAAGVLFAGDTLFADGCYGRTDVYDGSYKTMMNTLGTKFAAIGDDVVIYSGHDRSSTMGRERKLNKHLR